MDNAKKQASGYTKMSTKHGIIELWIFSKVVSERIAISGFMIMIDYHTTWKRPIMCHLLILTIHIVSIHRIVVGYQAFTRMFSSSDEAELLYDGSMDLQQVIHCH